MRIGYTPLTDDQLRQSIDAQAAFSAWEDARKALAEVRGSMFWRVDRGREYLIRADTRGRPTRLGARTPETEAMYQCFAERKERLTAREKQLRAAVERNRRLNYALRVGRCPLILVDILQAFAHHGVAQHFLTVGTHALYAYEAAAGVRLMPESLATRDVDFLFDTRKRATFWTQLQHQDISFLDILRKADKSFDIKPDQLQTAVNADGYEVDLIRRMAGDADPHPLRMSEAEEDMWPVQVSSGDFMLGAGPFSQLLIATNGSMARMNTIAPASFVKLKRGLSVNPNRDPQKKQKDATQAEVVQTLMDAGLL